MKKTSRKYLSDKEIEKYRVLGSTTRSEITRELARAGISCSNTHVWNILRGNTPSNGDTAMAVLALADKKLKSEM